jgi:tetratricopeptide (TPR) repeat protein
MNKKLGLALVLVLLGTMALVAQTEEKSFAEASGTYYKVYAEQGQEAALALAKEMDARFAVYNRLFRFPQGRLSQPLVVRSFVTKDAYDTYVSTKMGTARNGAVYLHYNNRPELNELVLLENSEEAKKVFPHQAFIQFLRAFVPNPPTWLQEGLAIYFTTLGYDRNKGEATYEENLSWLEMVKSWGTSAPTLEAVVLSDIQNPLPSPQIQGASWALVSFLLNTDNEEYRRSLYEIFMVLSPTETREGNSKLALERILPWVKIDEITKDYQNYIRDRKTFNELVDAGRQAYSAKDLAKAEVLFLSAMNLQPNHYAPHYYLGLLSYEQKKYDMAENYYRSALLYGADEALVNYALGLNAGAAGRKADAVQYLEKAAAAAPDRYKAKVQELLPRFR